MTTTKLTPQFLQQCANDPDGPVAIHLKLDLIPVEGKGEPFFPPTYATATGYQIDTLHDGTQVAQVDSVGAQANRMEPIFKQDKYRELVPQIEVEYHNHKHDETQRHSILEIGHRLGDAFMRCSELRPEIEEVFLAHDKGDSEGIAKLAPTTLIFGAWDSRGTGVKIPRLIQSTIRAWDVSPLTRSAQYFPPIDYSGYGIIPEKQKKDDPSNEDSTPEAKRGFVAIPCKTAPGGVVARGGITRNVMINLIALRRLSSSDGDALREYLLGLALVAATARQDLFLRQGCTLTLDPDTTPTWHAVQYDGSRQTLAFDQEELLSYARDRAQAFGVGEDRCVRFDKELADSEIAEEKSKKEKPKKEEKSKKEETSSKKKASPKAGKKTGKATGEKGKKKKASPRSKRG